jgi:UDP-N-acetylmuramoyl-tripeptide--D-alanyl-D-alanine ligase
MRTAMKKTISYVLQAESKAVLWKYKPKIIAITGSLGKTSTKDAVFAALSGMTHVRKSEKSYNSEIGLPLTILGLPNAWNNPFDWFENFLLGLWLIIWPHKYPKWLVLEVGVGKAGDMKKTASWLKTDAVIITAIGETPAHIEFFSSRKHLIEEKSQLIHTLKKDGLLVLNADDEAVLGMKEKTRNRIITYGFNPEADVVASQDAISYGADGVPEGIIFRVDEGGNSMPVAIEGVFGRNHLYASLAAIALSVGLKFNVVNAIGKLKNYDVPAGRMRVLAGINGSSIIDDTYNSSPFACESALRTLKEVGKGRNIAILGDMLELGKHTIDSHRNIGKIAAETADILIVVGPRAKDIAEGAREAKMKKKSIFEFNTAYEAGEFAEKLIEQNDLILVKGSQGVRMERTVEAIMRDKANKAKLLVRQDKEWLEKK